MNSKSIQSWLQWLTTSLIVFGLYNIAIGQTASNFTATINSENLIVITDSNPEVQESYLADISNLGLATEQDAIDKFNMLSDNLISFKLNWAELSVSIELRIDDSNSAWSINDWNKYLLDKSKW